MIRTEKDYFQCENRLKFWLKRPRKLAKEKLAEFGHDCLTRGRSDQNGFKFIDSVLIQRVITITSKKV